jgi:hypothetical protein
VGCHDEAVEVPGARAVDDGLAALPAAALLVVGAALAGFPGLDRFGLGVFGFAVSGVFFGVEELEPGEGFEVVV